MSAITASPSPLELAPQTPPERARGRRFRVRGNELAIAGALIVLLLVFTAVLAPVVAPYDPVKLSLTQRLRPPSTQYFFGTDEFGRDIFSRVLFGAQISLQVAGTVILLAVGVGVTLGALGAYRGGRWDESVMRVSDVFMAFPDLVLAMALSAALGAN